MRPPRVRVSSRSRSKSPAPAKIGSLPLVHVTRHYARVKTLGFPFPFRQTEWSEISEFLGGMAERYPSFQYMADVVTSVIDSRSTDLLAASTSMHDLLVVATPIPDAPVDLVAVRAPGSLRAPSRDGLVLIEHVTVSGHNDRIERPVAEAVPLFWRFMIEKYGVHPAVPPEDQSSRRA